jgi:hypothetical protein
MTRLPRPIIRVPLYHAISAHNADGILAAAVDKLQELSLPWLAYETSSWALANYDEQTSVASIEYIGTKPASVRNAKHLSQ